MPRVRRLTLVFAALAAVGCTEPIDRCARGAHSGTQCERRSSSRAHADASAPDTATNPSDSGSKPAAPDRVTSDAGKPPAAARGGSSTASMDAASSEGMKSVSAMRPPASGADAEADAMKDAMMDPAPALVPSEYKLGVCASATALRVINRFGPIPLPSTMGEPPPLVIARCEDDMQPSVAWLAQLTLHNSGDVEATAACRLIGSSSRDENRVTLPAGASAEMKLIMVNSMPAAPTVPSATLTCAVESTRGKVDMDGIRLVLKVPKTVSSLAVP